MQIKEKGLKLDICTVTGNCLLTYCYPIKKEYENQMAEVAKLHNAEIIRSIKGNLYIRYKTNGTSTSVISNFRVVQKQFMLHSRECKIATLQQQVKSLLGVV